MAPTSALWSPDHLRKLQAWEDEEDAGDLPRLTKRDMLGKQKQFQHLQQQQKNLAVAAAAGAGGAPRRGGGGGSAGGGAGGAAAAPRPPPPVAHQYSSCIFGPTSPAGSSCNASDATAATCCSSTAVLSSSLASLVSSSSDHEDSPPPPPPPSSPNPAACTPSPPPLPKATIVVSGGPSSLLAQQEGRQKSLPGASVRPRRATTSPFSSPASSSSSSTPSPFRVPLRRTGEQQASKDQGEQGGPPAGAGGPNNQRVSSSLPPTPSRPGPPAASSASPKSPPSPSPFDLNKILCFPSTLFQLAASTTAATTGAATATTTTRCATTTAEATPPRHNNNSQPRSPVVSAPFSSEQLLILDDLRHLLSGRSGSEAFEFLQHMVVDLMREVDSTNDEMDDQADKWKKRHESWLEQRREVADCVSAALREHVEDRGGPLPSGHVRAKKRLLHQLASSPPAASKASLSLSSKPIVDGTNLVVEHMAGQIRQLKLENEKLKERVAKQQSALDDLGGVAESRQVKIEALEQQFVALNDSRGSLARKLVDRTNEMIRLQFGSVPRLVSVRTAASSDGSVEVQQVDGEGDDGKEEGGAKSALGRRCAAALAAVDPDDSDDDEGGRAPTDEAGTEQGGDEEDGDGDEDDDEEEEDRQALLTHSLD